MSDVVLAFAPFESNDAEVWTIERAAWPHSPRASRCSSDRSLGRNVIATPMRRPTRSPPPGDERLTRNAACCNSIGAGGARSASPPAQVPRSTLGMTGRAPPTPKSSSAPPHSSAAGRCASCATDSRTSIGRSPSPSTPVQSRRSTFAASTTSCRRRTGCSPTRSSWPKAIGRGSSSKKCSSPRTAASSRSWKCGATVPGRSRGGSSSAPTTSPIRACSGGTAAGTWSRRPRNRPQHRDLSLLEFRIAGRCSPCDGSPCLTNLSSERGGGCSTTRQRRIAPASSVLWMQYAVTDLAPGRAIHEPRMRLWAGVPRRHSIHRGKPPRRPDRCAALRTHAIKLRARHLTRTMAGGDVLASPPTVAGRRPIPS